ncbi:MAG: aminotransferase class I/II-fold pyridoxal phosphate-dependent enzyme, partial [Pirellulales bacterium]
MSESLDSLDWIDGELESLASRDLARKLRVRGGPQSARIDLDGRELISFAANDYLGLAGDRRLADAVTAALEGGWGAGSSPLVSGRGRLTAELELRLAQFEGTEAALGFSSGFAANAGSIAALAGRGDAVYSDELNHASIVDGCRLSRAQVHVYPHADCQRLEELLSQGQAYRRRLIVTDSLFSMDGDLAPLADLARLARRYGAMLLVDEAHATGVFGRLGRGVAEHFGVEHDVAVRVGTLSKALGGIGGFVCGSRRLIEWLVNRARPYVFSTAPPDAAAAAAMAALEVVRNEPQRRLALLDQAA